MRGERGGAGERGVRGVSCLIDWPIISETAAEEPRVVPCSVWDVERIGGVGEGRGDHCLATRVELGRGGSEESSRRMRAPVLLGI
jgi:hypothetical protein